MAGNRFCVIGAVAAGMSAASQIKRRAPQSRVTVLERGQDVSYGACGMPYNIGDPSRKLDDLMVMSAQEFIDDRGIDLRLGHEVTGIDREAMVVRGRKEDGSGFEVDYNSLIIATGSRAVRPPIPGIDSPGVFTLRTLADGRAIKSFIDERRPSDAIVIGGSYLGLEMAEALHARGLEVKIVKRKPAMLGFLPDDLDDLVRKELEKQGVEVIHGRAVQGIEPGERLTMTLEGGELEADMIVSTTGFAPRSELGLSAGLEEGAAGAIAVDKHGRTSDPRIFAAGDCCDGFHRITGKRVWVPLALHANRPGRIVGANALGGNEEVPSILGTSAVRVFGLEIAGTGLSLTEAGSEGFAAVAATIKSRTRAHSYPGSGAIWAHLVADGDSGRLLGGAVVGEECSALRINVVAAALASGMAVREFANLDLMYNPPLAPAWDPLLVCANQLLKKAGRA